MNEMRNFNKQNSQSGQALVEYVLLLVIAIAIILGLASQLYKPFSTWAKDYMGQYVECLLDVGELPTIGGGTASGICNSKFKSFSVSDGRPPIPSSKAPKNNYDDGEDESARKERVRSADETGASSRASTADSSAGRSRRTSIGQNAGADGPSEARNGQQLVEKLPESQYMKLKSSNAGSIGGGGSSQDSKSRMVIPIDEKKVGSKKEKSVKVTTDDSGSSRSSKKLIIKPQERKLAAEADEQPWSFGQYIKFALILVIIVAIILFLGGQIMQISKGMEK